MRKVLLILNIILLVGLSGASVYLFLENRDLNDQLTLTTEEKNRRLVEEINDVYDLPDEEPVVAIVTNPDEFKTQYPAFDNAEAGDYLLFFRKNRLNVLYRQNERRVVKTANVVVPISLELVGSQAAIEAAEKQLADFGNQVTITKTVKEGITQAFVYDIDDDQADETKQVADVLGYDVGSTLPSSIAPSDQTEIIIAVADSSAAADESPSQE